MKLAPYPSYKPSGVEWLGDVPEHWEVDRLKWMAEGTVNGVWGDEPNDVDDLVCVRVADFDRERFRVHESPPTLRAIDPRQRDARLLRKGDLLIEKSGGGDKQLVGCVVLFDHEFDAVCSNFVARMPIARGQHSRFWVYAHAALYAGRVNYPAIKQTTGIQNLDSSAYLDTRVAFPPASEQRAIADFLDRETAKIDTLVARKRTLIERLKEKRTALISRTVTRGLPPDAATQAGLDPHPNLKHSGIDWLGDVPEHWEVARLSRVVTCLDGRRVPLNREERSNRQGPYPYWGANGIVDFIDEWLFDEQLVLLGEDGAPFFATNKEVAFFVTGKIWVNNHAHVLRPAPGVEGSYLAYALNQTEYGAFIDGSTRDKLTQDDMNAIPVGLPPAEEQRAIADFLDRESAEIDGMSAKIETAIERLQEYRTALITAAVTGKIDVRGPAA